MNYDKPKVVPTLPFSITIIYLLSWHSILIWYSLSKNKINIKTMKQETTLTDLKEKVEQHREKVESSFKTLAGGQRNLILLNEDLRNMRRCVRLLSYDPSMKGANTTSLTKLQQSTNNLLESVENLLQTAEKHLETADEELLTAECDVLRADQNQDILDKIETFLNQSQDERRTAQKLLDKADSLQERLEGIINQIKATFDNVISQKEQG